MLTPLKALIAPYLPWVYGGIAALLIASWPACYFTGKHAGVSAERARQAEAVAEAKARDDAAKAQADLQRAKDSAAVTQLQSDLSHAADALPDDKPSAVRNALSCKRLHAANPSAAVSAGC